MVKKTLTAKQAQISQLYNEGMSLAEIARHLNVSKAYITKVIKKLIVKQAITYTLKNNGSVETAINLVEDAQTKEIRDYVEGFENNVSDDVKETVNPEPSKPKKVIEDTEDNKTLNNKLVVKFANELLARLYTDFNTDGNVNPIVLELFKTMNLLALKHNDIYFKHLRTIQEYKDIIMGAINK